MPFVRSRLRSRSIAAILLTLLALPALATGALAAKPTFHDKIDVTFEDVDFCGVVGTLHVTGSQIITVDDDSFTATGQVTQVFTTADGRTAVLANAGTFRSTFTDNGDGTITFVDSFVGLPERIASRGSGGTELRDAGIISFITTIDLTTGEVTTQVVQRGPHPEADSDFSLFCTAFLAALG